METVDLGQMYKELGNNTHSYGLSSSYQGKPLITHYFTKFFHDKTELWFFGTGLGDQALISQLGDAFLKMQDPKLGRIVIGLGNTYAAYHAWKGEYNCHWVWAYHENWLPNYLEQSRIWADLFLCENHKIQADLEKRRLQVETLLFPAGVGDVFYPLGLKRGGLGYSGMDTKSQNQKDMVLGPFLDQLEIHDNAKIMFPTLAELNIWYNHKQILFGMVHEDRDEWGMCPSRVMETLASGTPLVQSYNWAIHETLGFNYPFLTESRQQTIQIVNEILSDYEEAHRKVLEYSKIVRERHHYRFHLESLFRKLEDG